MPKKLTFRAVIQDAGGGGAFVQIPFDVEQVFGKKRPKVKALIEVVPYRGLLVRMGGPAHMLIILKGIREKIGKSFGDEVRIVLEEDTEPRVVDLPTELAKAFEHDADVAAFFEGLAFSHKREYVNWINEAKQNTTRQSRVLKTLDLLKKRQKTR